jgi:hypothetical protein
MKKHEQEKEKKGKKESVHQATKSQDITFAASLTIFLSHAWLADSAASSHIVNDI